DAHPPGHLLVVDTCPDEPSDPRPLQEHPQEDRNDGGHPDYEKPIRRIEEIAANIRSAAEPSRLAHDARIAAPSDDAEFRNDQRGSHRRQDLRQRLEIELTENCLLDCEPEERCRKGGSRNRNAKAVMLEQAPRYIRRE